MKELPTTVEYYKSTPIFTQGSIPKGLLKAHQTKEGTWGKIVVLSGQLEYRILEPKVEELLLTSRDYGVVEPTVLHEVRPVGHVTFRVDFFRESK